MNAMAKLWQDRAMRPRLALVVGAAVALILAAGGGAGGPGGRIAYVMTITSEQLYRTPPGGHGTNRVTGNVWASSDPLVSPDGKTLLYDAHATGDWDIYARPVAGGAAIDLTPRTASQDYEGAWSPDGARIAFVSDRASKNTQLFVMNADGSSVRQLTHDSLSHELPSWSPDGKTILFDTSAKSQGDIYAIGDDGSGQVQLTSSKRDEWGARWSPNGEWIAFTTEVSFDNEPRGKLWLMHPDGSAAHQIPKQADDDISYPTWSRDSTRLSYSDTRGDCGIYSVGIDGTHRRVIVNSCNGHALIDVVGLHLSQGPDGTLWYSEAPSSTSDLATIAPDGSEPVTLTFDDNGRFRQPAWSPDGRTIAYTSDGNDIWTMNAATGKDRRDLSRSPRNDEEAAWSPDGKTIAFATNRGPKKSVEIYLMNRNGGDQRPLVTLPGNSYEPAWSPDGKTVSFANAAPKTHRSVMYAIGVNGRGMRRLGHGEQEAWSPDGRTIAFLREGHVWRMDANGAHARVLASGSSPSWSPDGSRIAFARTVHIAGAAGPVGDTPARDEIWVMNADGSGAHFVVVACDDAQADDSSFPLCGDSPAPQWGR
jgi:Tol biopolymer transport system component